VRTISKLTILLKFILLRLTNVYLVSYLLLIYLLPHLKD